ncbi:MAG: hypothetical protein LQ339_007204 [Xanthoria mediterranea]|nr:MAG: hypothetical protein LQ339_007204 [Xanthoria mediterranea]
MPERAKIFQYAEFDIDALCRMASSLRDGQKCSCDPGQIPKSGSFNWVVNILFDDGVEWVLRSPRNGAEIVSDDTNISLLASEAATLKYIKAHSSIPVPEVFAYQDSGDNDVGIPYILMSKASGSALQPAWLSSGSTGSCMSQEQRAKIVSQLGAITWKLSRLRFCQAGSLFEESKELKVKECLSRGLLVEKRDILEDVPRGPFDTDIEYYEAHISAFLEHVKYLPLAHHCLFAPIPARSEYDDQADHLAAVDFWNNFVAVKSKIDGSHNKTDYVIAGEALLILLAEWTPRLSGYFASEEKDRFVLHHPDLSVDNIYVDEEFNITCIIDWAFCSAVPLPMLLIPPGLPQARDELDESLFPAFEAGFRNALEENLPEEVLDAEYRLSWVVSRNRPMWLFARFINLDSEADFYLFKALWDAVATCNQDVLGFFRSMHASDKYRLLQVELLDEDPTAEEMARKERRSHGNDVQALAISRKLTLVSEWASRYTTACDRGIRRNGSVFVADKKLWKWIDCCLRSSVADGEAESK